MTALPAARRAFSAPIAAQIVALLIGGMAVGQIFTLLIVVLTPPPRPPIYQLSEIAAALKGASLASRDGRPLVRTLGPPPLADGRQPGFVASARLDLAQRLQVGPDSLRLAVERPPRPPWQDLGPGPGPHDGGMGPPPGPPPMFHGGDKSWPIFGEFKAAVRQPSGQWLVVSPEPEAFPNAWQARLILWFLACMAVLGPAGYLFARRLVAPISAFAQAADRLGRDPGAPQLELSGPAEIGVAARAFNLMQARLKRYVDDRTSMIGAVAHDLRTPLARARFKLEAGPSDLRVSVGADIDQMEAMISAVLAFVRDASRPSPRTAVDLLSVLECAVDDARAAGGEAELGPSADPVVAGDALALQRLFANLIDNALTYGGRAEVGLRVEGEMAVTEITDRGPGLPAGELERVFEPFYRAEPSRNRETGGIGLGLAVARSIARAHGGDVALRAGAPKGLTAIVKLPLAPSIGARPPTPKERP